MFVKWSVGFTPALKGGTLSLIQVVDREEGPIDRATRTEKHTVGHNSVATFDVPRESVLENRGNAQPEYPLRGILAL